jgi:hypothetical protein
MLTTLLAVHPETTIGLLGHRQQSPLSQKGPSVVKKASDILP